jgi:hypothetical protein
MFRMEGRIQADSVPSIDRLLFYQQSKLRIPPQVRAPNGGYESTPDKCMRKGAPILLGTPS